MKNPKFPHYWICDDCARERGGVAPTGAVTIIMAKCEYCNGKQQMSQGITPWVDFDWPADKEHDQKAKVLRD